MCEGATRGLAMDGFKQELKQSRRRIAEGLESVFDHLIEQPIRGSLEGQ